MMRRHPCVACAGISFSMPNTARALAVMTAVLTIAAADRCRAPLIRYAGVGFVGESLLSCAATQQDDLTLNMNSVRTGASHSL